MNLRTKRGSEANMTKSFNDQFYNGSNPVLQQVHTIPVQVRRFYTDVDGAIVDKVTVPAALQTKYPIFLFAQFDRNGGYKRSLQVAPPMPGTHYLMTYTQGITSPFLSFTGFNTIKSMLKTGDVVYIYTDNIENPNYFIWIVLSCDTVSLASIVSNVESTQQDERVGALFLKEFNYYVDVRSQFDEAIFFTKFDNIGNYRTDSINPSMNLNPHVEQVGLLTIAAPFKLDQYIGIALYMQYASDSIGFDFQVIKI